MHSNPTHDPPRTFWSATSLLRAQAMCHFVVTAIIDQPGSHADTWALAGTAAITASAMVTNKASTSPSHQRTKHFHSKAGHPWYSTSSQYRCITLSHGPTQHSTSSDERHGATSGKPSQTLSTHPKPHHSLCHNRCKKYQPTAPANRSSSRYHGHSERHLMAAEHKQQQSEF